MEPFEVRPCAPDIAERVLAKLGFQRAPEPDLAGLDALFGAWCRQIPFDNLQKRLYLASRGAGPLPGSTPEELFRAWLEVGTGGTCWATAGALAALLAATGFTVRRALATMHPGPHARESNHGTVVTLLDGEPWITDPSVLHGVPLPLAGGARPGIIGGAEVRAEADGVHLFWRPLHMPAGMTFRVDQMGVSDAVFAERHDATRAFSLFNHGLMARAVRGDRVIGIAMNLRIELGADGVARARRLDDKRRTEVLVEELGVHPSVAARVPPDEPVSPPPGMPPERWAQVVEAVMAGLPRVEE